MNTVVDGIEIFQKAFDPCFDCPKCDGPCRLLGTLNEWKYWCPKCDARFNSEGEQYG